MIRKQNSRHAERECTEHGLKKWGLDKKLKESEVLHIVHLKQQRDAVGKPSRVIIRNRKIEWARIEKYIRRNPRIQRSISSGVLTAREITTQVTCRTPSPPPTGEYSINDGIDWNRVLEIMERGLEPELQASPLVCFEALQMVPLLHIVLVPKYGTKCEMSFRIKLTHSPGRLSSKLPSQGRAYESRLHRLGSAFCLFSIAHLFFEQEVRRMSLLPVASHHDQPCGWMGLRTQALSALNLRLEHSSEVRKYIAAMRRILKGLPTDSTSLKDQQASINAQGICLWLQTMIATIYEMFIVLLKPPRCLSITIHDQIYAFLRELSKVPWVKLPKSELEVYKY